VITPLVCDLNAVLTSTGAQFVVILIWAVEVLGVFFLILEICLKLKRVCAAAYLASVALACLGLHNEAARNQPFFDPYTVIAPLMAQLCRIDV